MEKAHIEVKIIQTLYKEKRQISPSGRVSDHEAEQEGANSPAALHACGANYYPSQERMQERAISPAARTTLHQGGSNSACGANYPRQALKAHAVNPEAA